MEEGKVSPKYMVHLCELDEISGSLGGRDGSLEQPSSEDIGKCLNGGGQGSILFENRAFPIPFFSNSILSGLPSRSKPIRGNNLTGFQRSFLLFPCLEYQSVQEIW